MGNLSTINRRSSAPALASPEVRALTLRYSNALDWNENALARSSISSQLAPSDTDRRALATRQREIADALIPADTDAVGLMITSLRSVMPSHDNSDPQQQVAMYRSALSKFPEWAIGQVCRAFLEGRAGGSTTFAPTPADIAARCQALISPHVQEAEQIAKVLTAEIRHDPTDEERQRIAEGLRALAARIGSGTDAEEEARQRELAAEMKERTAANRLEEQRRAGFDDGLDISVSLRRDLEAMRARRQHEDFEAQRAREEKAADER
jgi:hypothetical protein